MKVLMLTPTYGGVTGVGTACRGLSEALARMGHVVDVLHIPPGRTSTVTLVDHAGNHRRPRPLEAVLRWGRAYDVVHVHDDAASDGRDGGFSRVLARHPVASVVTLHSLAHQQQAALGSSRWRTAAQEAIQGSLVRRAGAVIVLTGESRVALVRRHPDRARHIRVVGNGVAPPDPPARERLATDVGVLRKAVGWGADHRVILYLGRLSREKGIDALAEAFVDLHSRNPEARLVLAGPEVDGSGERAEAVLTEAGLEEGRDYRRTGPVHPVGRDDLVADADLVVLPSRAEQVPMAALEAMVRQRPVALTALPHLETLFSLADPEGRLAWPIPHPPTPEGIATAISTVLESPDRRAMTRRAFDRVQGRFTWSQVAERTLEVYRMAATARPAPDMEPRATLARTLDEAEKRADTTLDDRKELATVHLNLERTALLRGEGDPGGHALRQASRRLWALSPPGVHRAEVAVVVPVHLAAASDPRAAWLREALASVAQQDLEAPIAVLVIDDGSDVDVEAVVRSVDPSEHTALHVLAMPHHTGHPGWARLEGYRWAVRTRTPFVAHLDSDDRMLPDRLRRSLEHLHAYPEVDLVHGAHRSIDEYGSVLDPDNPLDRWYASWRARHFGGPGPDPGGHHRHHRHGSAEIEVLGRHNFIHNATVVVRTEALLRAGIQNLAPTVPPGREDHELWVRLARPGRVDFLPDVVGEYRQHHDSLTARARI